MGEFSERCVVLTEQFGFVPSLFRAQSPLASVLDAEIGLLDALLFRQHVQSRLQKECVLLVLAAARQDRVCLALHHQMLRLLSVPELRLQQILADPFANLSPENSALVSFALGIASGAPAQPPLADQALLEIVLTTALGGFLGSLSLSLAPEPDFAVSAPPLTWAIEPITRHQTLRGLKGPELVDDFGPFQFLRERFRLVPSVFRAQTLRPDAIEAETKLMRALMEPVTEGTQILARVTEAFAYFLSTVRFGLSADEDIPLPAFPRIGTNKAHLPVPDSRQKSEGMSPDPDAECVTRVRGGDLDAFEELMNRHSQKVYRTLIGFLGDVEEARDAMQDTFLKAFQHLGGFEGRSKFSTWLVSIASNTAIQRLRDRKPEQSLDDPNYEGEEGFRPRQVQAWTDDPEQLYSQTEMRGLIESKIMALPAKYRVVLMLRDLEQLSIEESAGALSLGVPALKARLLRGRLMLREALAPHFIATGPKATKESSGTGAMA